MEERPLADYLLVPATITTQLEAVNLLLRAIGESPVDDLEDATGDVLLAIAELNTQDLGLQNKGWAWNSYMEWPLGLATDGSIPLPSQTLKVKRTYFDTGGWTNDVIQKGTRLWDRINNTFTFSTGAFADIVIRAPWDELPDAARRVIALRAARMFQASMQQSGGIVAQINQVDFKDAEATLERLEDDMAPSNQITGNASVQLGLRGNGVRRAHPSPGMGGTGHSGSQNDQSGSPDPGTGTDLPDFIANIDAEIS